MVRDALRAAQKTGLGQLTMRGKDYHCAIRPCGDGLLLETLHYEDHIRSAKPLFSQIGEAAPDPDLRDVATQLIDRKTRPFEPAAFTDHYAEALAGLIDRKRSPKTPRPRPRGPAPRPPTWLT